MLEPESSLDLDSTPDEGGPRRHGALELVAMAGTDSATGGTGSIVGPASPLLRCGPIGEEGLGVRWERAQGRLGLMDARTSPRRRILCPPW